MVPREATLTRQSILIASSNCYIVSHKTRIISIRNRKTDSKATAKTMASFWVFFVLIVIALCDGRFGGVNANAMSSSGGTLTDKFNDVLRDEDNMLVDISSLAKTVASSSSSAVGSSSVTSMEDNDDDVDDEDDNDAGAALALPLTDQVRLLSKQMSALMNRRREDYKMLETSLKNSVRKNSQQFGDVEMRSELAKLRQEVKLLRKENVASSKDRLTVEWFSQTVSELRSELAEVQEATSNTSRILQQRTIVQEQIGELQDDFHKMRLSLEALKMRQENTERIVKELRAEAMQSDEELRRSHIVHGSKTTAGEAADTNDSSVYVELEADHKMRHRRFLRAQLHDLEMSQKQMRHQLSELQRHRIGERLHSVETEQHRVAAATFNVSRQVSNLDRLHGTMLELLEDIESVQTKVDHNIPDIMREIAKVEFGGAQLTAEMGLLREEGHNAAKSIQAIAISVSTLQDERDETKQLRRDVQKLQAELDKISLGASLHKDIVHRRIEKMETESRSNASMQLQTIAELKVATELVDQLESVELQYESIVNRLPQDCSQVERTSNGLYLIAPIGQQKPVMTYCHQHWTTIQRRYDGSVDFNRSWDEYAQGFGSPSGEYWIGNEVLSHLTASNCTTLKIVMQDIYDNIWEAVYSEFNVGSRSAGFRLNVAGYTGNASDALDYQNHMEFSAIDVDRDISNTHCAGNYEGGWWFSHCQHANLNGRYNLGLTWFDATRNEWIAVKSSHMMVARRPDCSAPYTMAPTVEATEPTESATTTTSTVTETTKGSATISGDIVSISSSSSSRGNPNTFVSSD